MTSTTPVTAPSAVISTHNPANYTKLIAYLAFTALGALRLATAQEGGEIDLPALLQVLLAVLLAVGIWWPGNPHVKTAVAAAGAAVQALIALIPAGWDLSQITADQWAGVAYAGLAAIAVGFLPNEPKLAPVTTRIGDVEISGVPRSGGYSGPAAPSSVG